MNLYAYMTQLKTEDKTICISDIRFIGSDHQLETRYIVIDFDEEWIRVKNINSGEDSFQFINIHAISTCCVTNYSRRKLPR